jgi:hypothetical protein
MRPQIASIFIVYIFLLLSMIGNIAYFVYSTHQDSPESWTRYGLVPAMCFLIVVFGALSAFALEKSAKHPDIKHHASNQLKIVFVLVIGGILSAIQTSAHWLLESDFLAGFLNVILIGLVVYVLVCLVKGLVEFRIARIVGKRP